jgi:hypothetical protein
LIYIIGDYFSYSLDRLTLDKSDILFT